MLIIVFAVVLVVLMMSTQSMGGGQAVSFRALRQEAENDQIAEILVRGDNEVVVSYADGRRISYTKSFNDDVLDLLGYDNVIEAPFVYSSEAADNSGAVLLNLLFILVPSAIILFFFWRMMRNVRSGQDQAMSFGRSKARVSRDMERPQVTFDDVAGAEEAKEELKEVVEFLKEPEKFIRLGARVPKGVLMVGPPGTGKTLMARAVAGEAGAPFFSISGSEFVEMFVGVGASRVRDLFERAKSEAPAIIFIDEIDAVGRQRGAGLGGGHDEREQTLNQILVEMDGFENDTNVIIIAATNRPDILDPALLRPGRFDRKVVMDNPDVKGREDILKVHTRGKPLAPDVDIEALSRITAGFSGADLENLVNEAAILAARRNKKSIAMSEMQESMERVVMGPERRSRVITPEEKERIAYHEAGHAILFHVLEHSSPVHKITIVSRGQAGGYVMPLPTGDKMLKSKEEFEDDIVAAMGGRAAEEIIYNNYTTGAQGDLRQATRMARAMVTQFGMSERLGPRAYGSNNGPIFLGREMGETRDYSEQYAQAIDDEVKGILQSAYQRAKNLLLEYHEQMQTLVRVLIERETLTSSEFVEIIEGDTATASSPFDMPLPGED
ncbi:ATP-dependent zinc metalloprotease FtsH [Phototrophicus methaneseepsis]|uniref:ATP-dependent zinc metalloprotease FtsH n=1 Tax=Phototrophicus methaneseepsis TaxID=2710758 RepID=A0A7S8EE25_9CHLR|nr:ATP-dependent zinc metalloprotease FtsH [Phototrophicus methaneseepsis]